MVLGLRAVMDAFGEVANHAGAERAVAAEAQLAFKDETDLLEIMPVARRIEIGGGATDRQLEIIDAAFLALGEVAEMERAAAIFEPTTPFERITVYDLHRFLLDFNSSLRAERSNPELHTLPWIASSLTLLAMTVLNNEAYYRFASSRALSRLA